MRKERLTDDQIEPTSSERGDILICQYEPCSKEYRRSGRSKFCSIQCTYAEGNARKNRHEVICQNDACKKVFQGQKRRKYCSEECLQEGWKMLYGEKLATEYKPCEFCNLPMPAWFGRRAGLVSRKFCSTKCSARAKSIKSKGITVERFWEMWNEQEGKCQICFCPLQDTSEEQVPWHRHVAIDHNHKTLKVRALLHRKCNFFLGGIENGVQATKNCLIYLEKHSEAK